MTPLLQASQLQLDLPARALQSISLAVARAEAVRLAGPSGCGKTSVLRALTRLDAVRAGDLLLQGVAADQVAPASWRSRVAYLPQAPVMLPGSVEDNLRAGFASRNRSRRPFDALRATQLMARLDLAGDAILARNAQLLSGGEASRVALCRALLLDPIVLLADELCAQLDPARSQAVVRLCAEFVSAGGGMVLTAHDVGPWSDFGRRVRVVDLEAAWAPAVRSERSGQ